MNGEIIGVASVDVRPHVGTDEEPLVKEYAGIFGIGIGGGAFRVEMVEPYVTDLTAVSPAYQGIDEAMRHAGHTAEMDMIVGFDSLYGLVCC